MRFLSVAVVIAWFAAMPVFAADVVAIKAERVIDVSFVMREGRVYRGTAAECAAAPAAWPCETAVG